MDRLTAADLSAPVRSCIPQRLAGRTSRRFCFGRGFTFIELVMVLVLISIMSAIALPKYASAMNRYRADAAARRIMADLNYARSLAIATSTTTTITFNCNASTYQIAGATDPDHGGTFSVTLSGDPYLSSLSSAAAVSGVFTLSFNGYGIPTSTPSIVVTSGDSSRTVTVNADIGTATLN
jgi:prepilin-type N-terminal cleavage/methylation domain-containing protein